MGDTLLGPILPAELAAMPKLRKFKFIVRSPVVAQCLLLTDTFYVYRCVGHEHCIRSRSSS